ncbi:MAG: cobalamin-binding protein [Pyrinomonadaceae bacterium]
MFTKVFQPKYFVLLTVFLLCCGITACQSANSARQQTASPNAEQQQLLQREVIDDLGRRVRLPANIERVISLAPSLTESVFAIGAGNKLVGVTSFCNYPEEARKLPKIGDTMKPNLETIVSLKPQLVLISTDSQLEGFLRQLEANNIPAFVTEVKDFDGVLTNLRQLGDLLDHPKEAEKLVSDLQTRVTLVQAKVKNENSSEKPVRVFVQISREPLYTIGKSSFLTDLVHRAGGESVTSGVETAYPNISRETALAAQPEAIILSVDESMGSQNTAPDDAFKNSPAVKNNRVYPMSGDLLTRPSPRTADLIEQIARALHPNAF